VTANSSLSALGHACYRHNSPFDGSGRLLQRESLCACGESCGNVWSGASADVRCRKAVNGGRPLWVNRRSLLAASRTLWRSELRIALIFCLCASMAACDGGFQVRGSIAATGKPVPTVCKVELKGPPHALICCNRTVAPPAVAISFTAAPEQARYKLLLLCDGFRLVERDFMYGLDATPTKPLELGVIKLQPSAP
jgi:hypothetical protein